MMCCPRHVGNRGNIALAELRSAPCPFSSPRSRCADEAAKSEFLRRRVAKSSGSIPQKYPGSKKRASANDDKSAHGCRPGFPDQVARDLLERDSGNSGETKSAKQIERCHRLATAVSDRRTKDASFRSRESKAHRICVGQQTNEGTSNPKIEFADLKFSADWMLRTIKL
jgi:hypothetical protein